MANVDPFVIKWPDKWLIDPEIGPVVVYLNRFLHDLWGRSGFGTDNFDQILAEITAIKARLDLIEGRLDVIEAAIIVLAARITYLEGLTVVTAIDHTVVNTVTGIQTIICTAAVTVDLILVPNDRDKVIVISKGNNVVIDGNGKTIGGDTTVTLRPGFKIGLQMEYSSALGEWFRI